MRCKSMNIEFINNEPRGFWEDLIFQNVHNEKSRQILKTYLLDNGTYEGTAEICNVSSNTVYNKIQKYVPILSERYYKKYKKM